MLKFVVEKEGAKLVFLGLSLENLARLRAGQAIQFLATEVGLGEGVFVVAHMRDPMLPHYRSLPASSVCELLVLSEKDCQLLLEDLLERPLRSLRGGRRCQAHLFAGTTEEGMVEALRQRGLITEASVITRRGDPAESTAPGETAAAPGRDAQDEVDTDVDSYGVSVMSLLKVGGGGLVLLGLTVMVLLSRRIDLVLLLGIAGCAIAAVVLLFLAFQRLGERVELDARCIRRQRLLGGFQLTWQEISEVRTGSDSLGVFEVHLVTTTGQVHKLARIYEDWDDLVQHLLQATGRAL